MSGNTTLGLKENLEGCLAYSIPVLAPISGILLLIFEKDNKFVRFHAMQSFIVFSALMILSWLVSTIVGWITIIGGFSMWVTWSAIMIIWLILTVTTFFGRTFKIPIIGNVIYNKMM